MLRRSVDDQPWLLAMEIACLLFEQHAQLQVKLTVNLAVKASLRTIVSVR